MSGRRVSDLISLLRAVVEVASKHVDIQSQNIKLYTETSSIARKASKHAEDHGLQLTHRGLRHGKYHASTPTIRNDVPSIGGLEGLDSTHPVVRDGGQGFKNLQGERNVQRSEDETAGRPGSHSTQPKATIMDSNAPPNIAIEKRSSKGIALPGRKFGLPVPRSGSPEYPVSPQSLKSEEIQSLQARSDLEKDGRGASSSLSNKVIPSNERTDDQVVGSPQKSDDLYSQLFHNPKIAKIIRSNFGKQASGRKPAASEVLQTNSQPKENEWPTHAEVERGMATDPEDCSHLEQTPSTFPSSQESTTNQRTRSVEVPWPIASLLLC